MILYVFEINTVEYYISYQISVYHCYSLTRQNDLIILNYLYDKTQKPRDNINKL